MNLSLRISIILLILHFSLNCNCQETELTTYKRHDVVNLLEEIQSSIETIHPNPYHSTRKNHVDSLFNNAVKSLPDEMDEVELYKLILPLVNSFNDGHIQLTCPFGKFINKGLNENKGIFPFTLYQLNSGVYVKIPVFDSIVKPGYRLRSIDNVSVDSLVSTLSAFKFGDNISIRKRKAIEDFAVLEFFVNQGKELYEIEYQRRDSDSIFTCTVNSAKIKDIINFNNSFKIQRKKYFSKSMIELNGLIYFKFHPDRNIALLTLPSFDVDRGVELMYSQKIDSVFQLLNTNKIDTILIDIRGNNGGSDYPSKCILKHIAFSDYSFGQAFMKSSKYQRDFYEIVLKSKLSDTSYLNSNEYSTFFTKRYGEVFALKSNISKKSDNSDLYKGNVFILTNKKTFSAAVSLAAVAKCYDFATIVGEETDGRITSYTSLVTVPLSIPSIQFGVAHRKVINACSSIDSSAGLTPDIYIKKTHESILSEKDIVLEYFLK
jgi:C-terminal processing protease CtpA/Prc